MKILRTPDKYFENLPDFPFKPHYVEIDDGTDKIRMHYLEEGPVDGEIILCCTENLRGAIYIDA